MINHNADKINKALGCEIFNVSNIKRLEIVKRSKKYIKENLLDDLLGYDCKGTPRLSKFVKEILFERGIKWATTTKI